MSVREGLTQSHRTAQTECCLGPRSACAAARIVGTPSRRLQRPSAAILPKILPRGHCIGPQV